MTMLLSEQLRPSRFDDLTLPNSLKMRLQKMYDTRNVMNMLFYGKPGTGKTTAAKIFTKSEFFDAIEINGSLQTSIEEIRSTVQCFATSCSLFDTSKICFIDEAEYLSKNSQAGLRSLIESSSENCRYIFTANDLSKIHPALCSRLIPICFDMTVTQTQEALDSYVHRLIEKLRQTSSSVNEDRVKRIVQLNYPDFRTIANHLEFELL
jgi:replication-associated recombination protein RarA